MQLRKISSIFIPLLAVGFVIDGWKPFIFVSDACNDTKIIIVRNKHDTKYDNSIINFEFYYYIIIISI